MRARHRDSFALAADRAGLRGLAATASSAGPGDGHWLSGTSSAAAPSDRVATATSDRLAVSTASTLAASAGCFPAAGTPAIRVLTNVCILQL
jgi:hypothetical protein